MTRTLPFADETFDLIVNPVSNCYIKEVEPVFKECYRVLKRGGELIGGQLAAGFTLIDIYDDTNGYGKLEEYKIPTFIATRGRKA